MAATTQTVAGTSAAMAALTLANTTAPTGKLATFISRPHAGGGGGNPPGGGPPGGGGFGGLPPVGPPGGGDPPGGPPPAGPPGGGAAAPGEGGNGKLGGNPPSEFDGDHSKANTFRNQFNLYRITNIDAEQMTNPMKRTALFLRFLKGPNVKDWVRKWTNWIVEQYNLGHPSTDEYYWNQVALGFENAFQDTGARERAEDKLRHLNWMPNEVDTFIAQFESLAEEAGNLPNAQPTLTLFALKLPGSMVNHIYKVVQPQTFQDWADTARQFHRDNIAVQNLHNISEDFGGRNKGGMMASQLAALLKVKLPLPNPNAMDTRADRSRSNWRNHESKSRAVTTTEDDTEKQRKEGQC